MPLFREQDRLKIDPRILQISDEDDLALLRRRDEIKIKGLLLPYEFDTATAKALTPFMSLKTTHLYYYQNGSRFHDATNNHEISGPSDMAEFEELKSAFENLSNLFTKAVGRRNNVASLRINWRGNDAFHTHDFAAFTYTGSGQGTLVKNTKGEIHAMPPRHVFAWYDLKHREGFIGEDTRATFALF